MMMKSALLLAPLLAAAQALFGQAATGSIEGQVVDQTTKAPIRRANVNLRLTTTGRTARPGEPTRDNVTFDAQTDEQGRFIFRNLEAGAYQISAQRQGFTGLGVIAANTGAGYMYAGVGIQTSTSYTVFLGEGQQLNAYPLPLVPQAVIAGKVLDNDGEPVTNCQVAAWRWGYSNGTRQLIRVATSGSQGMTNDLGEFRMAGLQPGSYFISATPTPAQRSVSAASGQSGQPEMRYVTTYYPSATDPAAATPIEIPAGRQATGMDIKLSQSVTYTVRGVAIDPEGYQTFVTLRPRSAALGFSNYSSSIAQGVAFTIAGVQPGSYDLVAQRTGVNSGPMTPVSTVVPIEVKDRNLDGITVRITPPSDIQGVVRTPASGCGGNASVSLASPSGAYYGNPPQPAPVGADGKFTLKNVSAGRYVVNFQNAGFCYVRSVQYAGVEVPETGAAMDGSGAIEITLAADAGNVRASAVDVSGRPAPRATVVMIRRGGASSSSRQPRTSTGSGLMFNGLAPGTYDLFAFEMVDYNAIRSPEYLRQFAKLAKTVTVESSGSYAVQVTVIPASEIARDPAASPGMPAPQIQRVKGGLEGRVVTGGAEAPLQGMYVALRGMFASAEEKVAVSGDEGGFAFPDLEPGIYNIGVRRADFAGIGPRQFFGENVIVGEGQKVAGYLLRFTQPSVISGKVLDEYGDPVERASVTVFRYQYVRGERRLALLGPGAATNDLGEYRIANLPPGRYYVCARTVPATVLPTAREQQTGYAPAWYSGAATANAASPVTVRPGSEIADIDFKLRRVSAWRVTGRVIDPAATTESISSVSLYPAGSLPATPLGTMSVTRNGVFEISGVPPGSYVLLARGMPARQGVAGVPPTRMGIREIEVKDAPVEGLTVTLEAGREVKSTLKTEGGGSFFPGMLTLVAQDGMPQARAGNQVGPPRTTEFVFQNVFRTTYALELTGSGNFYVKSVRYAGREYPANNIDLTGDGELEIVISSLGGTLEGSVVDRAAKPAANAAVVIAQVVGAAPLKKGWADARGNFFFTGIAPGEYRVFAWEASAPEADDPPASLAPYESGAKRVSIQQVAREKIQVTAISR